MAKEDKINNVLDALRYCTNMQRETVSLLDKLDEQIPLMKTKSDFIKIETDLPKAITYAEGFFDGYESRIIVAWYPVDETPRDNSLILCKTKDDDYFLYGKNQRYYKEMSEDVEMWAYIEDLIPTNK